MDYARIAVTVATLIGEFDYQIPPGLEGKISSGQLVTAPFGKQVVQGIVLELVSQPAVAETKSVVDLLDPLPVLTRSQVSLAKWLSIETLSPLAACIGLMLPSGLNQQADTVFEIRDSEFANRSSAGNISSQISSTGLRLVKLLTQHGPMRGRQVDRHFRNVDWRRAAQSLVKIGLLTKHSILPPPSVRPKYVRTAQLSVSPNIAEAAMPDLGKTPATLSRRQAALRFLIQELADVNVSWVYAESGCSLADLQELADRELIVLRETEIWRDPLEKVESSAGEAGSPPELTSWQSSAWEKILQVFRNSSPSFPYLLYGVTGSGKTEIYLRAAQECISRGKEAIILVPEIAITPQTVRRFLARFPGQVGLVHSKLSDGERYDTWRRARLGQLKVIIGPRSALFTPLPHLGLIAVDECHDGSYSQTEPPFYNAVTAAQEYARMTSAVCILGSATPTIVQRYYSNSSQVPNQGENLLLTLPERIVNPNMPAVQVVDMRAELKSGNRGIFSQELIDALDKSP